MNRAIDAYHSISSSSEFKEIERLRAKARHDEAQALYHATKIEQEKWHDIIADKDAEIARLQLQLAELRGE